MQGGEMLDFVLVIMMVGILVTLLSYLLGSSHAKPTVKEVGNMRKRIIPENHRDLVEGIENTYNGARINDTYINRITIDGDDVTIEIDVNIDGGWGITGTFQIELSDDNTLAEKLREILALEDGND